MVAPTWRPSTKYWTSPFADELSQRSCQTMPVDRPLAYRRYWYYGRSKTDSGSPTSESPGTWTKQANFSLGTETDYGRKCQHAYNQAYERIKSQVADRAGWAENFAQINKTRKTVVERCEQLASFARAVKRGQFGKAAKVLRTAVPSGVSNRKAAAQNFLEWEYGVKPLISDIDSSMRILLSDPGTTAVRGRASAQFRRVTKSSTKSSNFASWTNETVNGKVDYTCRALVRVTNPNVFLANQLGLLDLALPWKLIPFSFIVDWFVNVEQVISSVTDWYGVTLLHPHYSIFVRGSYTYDSRTDYDLSHGLWNATQARKEQVDFERILGLPSPSLVVKPFEGFSIRRGAQAIALVLAVFGK